VEQEALQDKAPEEMSKCWGCGRNNEHGLQIKSYWTGEEAVCTWKPQKHHLAFPGILNGGIIAALIDCHCMATAGATIMKEKGIDINEDIKEGIITDSLFIKYLKPTPINYPVTLRARVKEINDRKITIFCELYSKDKLCVTGEAVAIKITT
jgi:acyl-coenzyme A thioesterase PaaI-like protein